MIFARIKGMRSSDWAVLTVISLAIGSGGVMGTSYVVGEGWPTLSLIETLLLTLLSSVIAGILLILLEALARIYVCKPREDKNSSPIDTLRDSPSDSPLDSPLGDTLGEQRPKSSTRQRIILALTPRMTAKSIIGFAMLMALFWLPWYIANFPGGTYWDTYYQMFQVYPENHPIAVIPWAEIYDQTLTDAWLVDHHPIFTTLVYGAFGWVSDQLTGNWMAGVAAFCILQGLAHNFVFTWAVAHMRRAGAPTMLNLIAYWFFAIMPFVSTWALCMVKDSFFGLFAVPYFICLFDMVLTRGASLRRPRNVVLFAIWALMLCLTKKTGVFVVMATCFVGIVSFAIQLHRFNKRQGRQPAAPTFSPSLTYQSAKPAKPEISPSSTEPHLQKPSCFKAAIWALAIQAVSCWLVLMVVFPFALFPALNIEKGGLQETLGPMLQQTARTVIDYPDDITIEERNVISKVLDFSAIKDNYEFDFEDSIKYRYNLDATPQELMDYFKVYVDQGIRHPDSYFGAIAGLAGFYVAPTAYINIRMVTVDTHMGDDDRYMLWNPDELDGYRHWMDDAYKAIGEFPAVNLPLLIVVYAFWLPAALIYTAYRSRLRCAALFVPALVLLAFCVIAPVYDARYVIPIFDMAPLLLCAVICLLKRNETGTGISGDSNPKGYPQPDQPDISVPDGWRDSWYNGSGYSFRRHSWQKKSLSLE